MDSFLLSIIIISVTGVIGAFIKGKQKDRCFKYFQGLDAHILTLDDKDIWGKFNIESNAVEVQFNDIDISQNDKDRFSKTNFIFYKSEFSSIKMLVHFIHNSDEIAVTKRDKELNKLLNPSIFKRSVRKVVIFFNVVKDALLEVVSSVMVKSKLSEGNREKLIGTFKDNSLNSYSGENHQPIWEDYIGKHVIVEQIIEDKVKEYTGVLKEYSANYILLFNVDYSQQGVSKKADIIFPRINAIIRHAVK